VTIQQFASKHRLKTRVDTDGTTIIPGRYPGCHIYEHDEEVGEFGVVFISSSVRTLFWNKRKSEAEATGMRVVQSGDAEGAIVFDPEKPEQVRVALRTARVLPKRRMSEEQRQLLVEQLRRVNPRTPGKG